MPFYSLNQIQRESKISNVRQRNLERKSLSQKRTVFLSHSHQDNDIVLSIIEFLLRENTYVYVDWLDPTMPKVTSAETATKIKERIIQCDRFIVLLSENSKESRWVPWELGFADAKKDNSKISIFPIKRNLSTSDSNFDGLEYMELYQTIKIGISNDTGENTPIVIEPGATKGYTLYQWL